MHINTFILTQVKDYIRDRRELKVDDEERLEGYLLARLQAHLLDKTNHEQAMQYSYLLILMKFHKQYLKSFCNGNTKFITYSDDSDDEGDEYNAEAEDWYNDPSNE